MLMHEWIRYRNRQVKPSTDESDEAAAAAADAETQADESDAEASKAEPHNAEALEATGADTPAKKRAPRSAQAAPRSAEITGRDREETLAALHEELERTEQSVRDRVRQLQARQKQLPIDIGALPNEPDEDRPRRAHETRHELVQRLLDPTLTLRDAAVLLDVCPTTVRRYTNRGLLSCFRTPGNQRRFHLSEVLEFMERHERGEV